jgi:hypothetical protein
MFGGPLPRSWRALFVSCFAIGCLWRVSMSSLLLLQRWTFELMLLFVFNITVIIVNWGRWFPSSRTLVVVLQQLVGAGAILGFFVAGGAIAFVMMLNPHPQIERSWDLPNDTHVDIFSARNILGPCRTLRERNRTGLTSQAWPISACLGGDYSAVLKRASSKCVVSVRVNEGDSVPDVLDESSIRFTPECHAVEHHD